MCESSKRAGRPAVVRGVLLAFAAGCASINATSVPGWAGQRVLPIPAPGLAGWSIEHDSGASGSLAITTNVAGVNVLRFNWNLNTGNWVQIRYDFATSFDASAADLFGVTLHGDASAVGNDVRIMFADTAGVTYGRTWPGPDQGINQVNRWLYNLAVPRKALTYFWGGPGTNLDWSRIKTFWLVLARPGGGGGGSGTLLLDTVQCDTAANWPRQTGFISLTNSAAAQSAASNAVNFILSRQNPATGLFVSWAEQPVPRAWLYDQALALIVLTRQGEWIDGHASNTAAAAADQLWTFLGAAQKPNGSWARCWNATTGAELSIDPWVGDQAWGTIALAQYADKSGNAAAQIVAGRNAQMLAGLINSSGGLTGYSSTEGTVDVWWAMVAMLRFADASRIQTYLLNPTNVWDADLQYWWAGLNDPSIAVDCATWLSAFARHPLVAEPQLGLAALSFVRKTLLTTDDSGSLYGLDTLGPVSIWNEGTAQFVAAGGQDAAAFLDTLLAQQNEDGSMPGSPDDWTTDAFGWLTPWRGVAPTAWLYFAIQGAPFPNPAHDTDGDGQPDWAEYLAGTNPSDPASVLKLLSVATTASGLQLTWQSVAGRMYHIERATNLGPNPDFSIIQSNITGQYGTTTCEDPADTNSGPYFYRVGVQF